MKHTFNRIVAALSIALAVHLCLLLAGGCKKANPPTVVAATNGPAAPAKMTAAAPAASVIPSSGPATRYVTQPGGCKVKFTGTSSLHEWTVEGQVISGYFEVNPKDLFQGQKGSLAAKVVVKIPVRSLKSGKEAMDDRMQKEMNTTTYPMIDYVLSELIVTNGPAGGPMGCLSIGNLAVSGVTNKIQMPVLITQVEPDALKVAGNIDLKMTSFKIEPPKFGIGDLSMKTGDDIKLSLEWVVKEKK